MSIAQFSNVERSFHSEPAPPYTAIRDFSLDIEDGEFFCVLGPSGCGKTTILNLLADFENPSDGAIYFGGAPIDGPGRDRAVVFQGDDSLYPWLTARENIEFGPRMSGVAAKERRDLAERFLRLVGLTR